MAATAVAAGTGGPAGTESAEGAPGPAPALELWLNKATDPSMSEQDWSAVQNFCEQVNTDPNGPTHAPWLLAHKIQSPQEKEALYALTVLEMCMNHCGEKFHSEVAKFRFLNELIKVLSPKLLTRLLKSNHPEDLQAANRLIKNLVKEEQEKSEKVSKRVSAVEEVRSHVKVLQEMLSLYRRPGQAPPDQEALQVVYERCEKLRPTLFRLASDTTDDNDALAEILQANDLLTQGVLLYKQVMEGPVTFGNAVTNSVGDIPIPRVFQKPLACTKNCPLVDLEVPSLLHQDLAALGISDAPVLNKNCCKEKKQLTAFTLPGGAARSPSADKNLLDLLSPHPSPGPLNYIPQKSIPKEVPPGTKASPGWSWEAGPLASSPASQNTPLAHVFVPLESVKPSSLPPLIVYDRNGFRILLHFSETGAPGHPEVQVLLLTMMSTATQPVWDIMFQVAVPKSMRVKLQPASSSRLPAFSPLMPPAVISQMLLLDNPHKEPIRLRYKLTFNQGGQPFSEVGEVKDFPDLAVLGTA
ncbi:ADP-ribosylation factor-binding protein GGA2 isoform X2 [Nannospalax galili]|uniref:ADP-ribosylation factor-binding protein GGA2 isoform X2 n=1 Tax=Nannospalax galili TaxID=1026970 RepID=UPI00111BD923|nr:ADP-ribosylation factor-binding protein GGA2 isoform X2 [Nannospalax galili]